MQLFKQENTPLLLNTTLLSMANIEKGA